MAPTHKALDGGYAWVMVGCSFFLHMLNLGFLVSLSYLYVAWLDEFGEGKGVTSWIISFGIAAAFMLGPIPARLIEIFGFRVVTVAGGLLTSAGYILAFLATSVPFLIVCIGGLAGIGCSLSYLPGIAIIGVYFDKRRSLAMGIGTCGVGIGAMVGPPLLNVLETEYGWRGSLLIMGALVLHKCVAGLLMRTPDKDDQDIRIRIESVDEEVDDLNNMENADHRICVDEKVDDLNSMENVDHRIGAAFNHENGTEYAFHQQSTENGFPTSKLLSLPKKTREALKCTGSFQQLAPVHSPHANGQLRPFISLEGLEIRSSRISSTQGQGSFHRDATSFREVISRSLLNVDMVLLGSSRSINLMQKDLGDGRSNVSITLVLFDQNKELVPANGDPCENQRIISQQCCDRKCSPAIATNLDLLRSKTFSLITVSSFLTNLSYITPVIYLVDRAVDNGIDKSFGALLIAIVGGGNLLGRFLVGYICNRFRLNSLVSYIVVIVSCGAATMASILCGDKPFLHGIYAAAFGLLMGSYVTLAPVVVMDLVGGSRLAAGYGLMLFFMGVANLIGPPLGGWIFDWTQTYALSYGLSGLFLLVSGGMLIPLTLIKRGCGCFKCQSSRRPEMCRDETLLNK